MLKLPRGPDATLPRPTLLSLARAAGVSTSTISRALKGDARISPETRQRIAALAAEAGYMPDALARTLSGGRSGLIGLVLGDVANPFYPELLQDIVAQAARRGIRLLLLHVGHGPIEDATAEALVQYRVDGALITSAELSSRAAAICAGRGVPVVMVNRVPRLHASAVACDNAAGGQEVGHFLWRQGHRRFAVIRGRAGTSTSLDRERGFLDALAESGAAPPATFEGGSTYEGGYAAAALISALPSPGRPTAVFAINDAMAMGAIDGFRMAGLPVPGAISVVGFDDIQAAARPPYDLTTVAQPIAEMVDRGLGLLLARIARADLPDEVVMLRGRLVVRGSVQPPSRAS
ncbi:LacI family DNA-binding transcriptional regulator [Falsiroseomonas sp. HC035]|uniref:LacI family DNA-binding transcriptional regulator n=1 Tax=Falsiroseomonas sp. HC035 TaxID=3390999 RepID=UPI003D313948